MSDSSSRTSKWKQIENPIEQPGLFALAVQFLTLFTQRFPAGALSEILAFDIVPRIAVAVVVVFGLLYGMER